MVDRAISSYSTAYGYPPAVKAFARVTYIGPNANDSNSYVVTHRFNIASTVSFTTFNRYILNFENITMDDTYYHIFIQNGAPGYASAEQNISPQITSKGTTDFSFRCERSDEASPGYVTSHIGQGIVGDYVDIVVIGR